LFVYEFVEIIIPKMFQKETFANIAWDVIVAMIGARIILGGI